MKVNVTILPDENNIVLKSTLLPKYESTTAAGCDVKSASDRTIKLIPNDTVLIPTGLSVEVPDGYEIQVRPRSGLALKHGITVLNTPGTIDSDYRGEIGVILINHGKEPFWIRHGDRIAQLVLNKVEQIEWNPVLFLTKTERNADGFGSTGKK